MSTTETATAVTVQGVRKSGISQLYHVLTEGKQWKAKSAPNKNPSLRTAFSKRITKDKQKEATKALERQLNEERKTHETVHSIAL